MRIMRRIQDHTIQLLKQTRLQQKKATVISRIQVFLREEQSHPWLNLINQFNLTAKLYLSRPFLELLVRASHTINENLKIDEWSLSMLLHSERVKTLCKRKAKKTILPSLIPAHPIWTFCRVTYCRGLIKTEGSPKLVDAVKHLSATELGELSQAIYFSIRTNY